MGHRPGDKDVLSPDDEGRSLLAVIRTFTRLIDGDWSAQRAALCLRSGKQDGARVLVLLDPGGRYHAFVVDLNGRTHHTFHMMDRHMFRSECGRRFRGLGRAQFCRPPDCEGNSHRAHHVQSLRVDRGLAHIILALLIRQAVHDRKAHDDLGFSDGMLHVERASEFHCFNGGRI